jgi:hypothetical protein
MSVETIFELKRMYKSYRTMIFITSFWHFILLGLVLLYLYLKYFHTKRFRWFNSAIMIKLEPENIEYCQKIAKFFTNYKLNASNKNRISYEPSIHNNIYFYETQMSEFVKVLNNIESKVFQDKSINITTIDKEKEDDYTDMIAKLINTDFGWSISDKFEIKDGNKEIIKSFFVYLKQLTTESFSNIFDNFIEKQSIFNFLDLDNLFLEDIQNILENKLIVKYGSYTEKSLKDLILEINGTYKNTRVDTFLNENGTNPSLTVISKLPIDNLLEELIKHIKDVLFKFYDIDQRYYNDYKGGGLSVKTKSKCSTDSIVKKDFGDHTENFESAMNVLGLIEKFKDLYKDKDNVSKFKGEYYLLIERLVYSTFNANTKRTVFSPNKANTIITIYQNIVDYIIYIDQKDIIDLAIRFTIHHFINPNKNKTESLQDITELYISFNELFLMNNTYKEILDEYNTKRKPDMKELKKLYNDSITHKTNYFINDGIINQWKALFSGNQPSRYEWMLKSLVDYIKSKSIGSILKSAISVSENFTNDEDFKDFAPEKEVITENFGNPFKALSKPFKTIANFLKEALEIVRFVIKLITKPDKLIGFFVKLLLAILLIILKLIFFTFKIKKIYPGELVLYFFIILWGTIMNVVLYVIVIVLTIIMMTFDITITNGLIYRFIYWMFGATENSPSAWYKNAGYHYGYDLCKKDNNTQCNGFYQNKAKRMFFAYYRCGDNYKPDRQTKGFMCDRKYEQEPGFCLQSNIYRLYNNLSTKMPYTPGSFLPTIDYLQSTEKKRKKLQGNFKNMKHNFYNNCNATMEPFDPLSKNICRVYSGVMNSNKNSMESLCFNTYCKNGNREPFCYKMTNNYSTNRNGSSGSEVISRMFALTAYFAILAYLINVFLQTEK